MSRYDPNYRKPIGACPASALAQSRVWRRFHLLSENGARDVTASDLVAASGLSERIVRAVMHDARERRRYVFSLHPRAGRLNERKRILGWRLRNAERATISAYDPLGYSAEDCERMALLPSASYL